MRRAAFRPVFLISLPRSGSTLLQKLLATSLDVATTNEPWIALPIAYLRRHGGLAAEYWHATCANAIDDVVAQFPNKEEDFRELSRQFILGTYEKLSHGREVRVFLDKTPRYYLISDFLAKTFPDALFVFLFRHPLDVMSSVLRTWHRDTFSPNLAGNAVDLWNGPNLLAQAFLATEGRNIRIHYEDLVSDPMNVLQRLIDFLDVRIPDNALEAYRRVELPGRFGDPTKGEKYDGIAPDSVDSWRHFVKNPYRKRFLRRYIRDLGDSVFTVFEISREDVLRQIDQTPNGFTGLGRDIVGLNWFWISVRLNRSILARGRNIVPEKKCPYMPLG